MVGRKKKPKNCDKVSQEDRISKLHDPLISEILYHLSTKEAVRTSVLSTRWKSLWQCVPALDLNRNSFRTFDAFVSFTDRVLDSHRKSWIRKLRLHTDNSQAKLFIPRWIDAVTTHMIQHLDVLSFHTNDYVYEIPQSLYTCKTLVHLQLFGAAFNTEFVSLPCLKIMHLDCVKDPNKAMLQKIISGSPVLEDLRIHSHSTDDGNVLQVCSQTIKKICINLSTKVLIDAPLLVHLGLCDATLAYFEFVSLPCLKIMHLNSVKDPSKTALQKFISGSPVLEDLRIISSSTGNAKVLQIFSETVKRIELYLHTRVIIDAPILQYLKTMVSSTQTFEIINLGISAKLDIRAASRGDETFSSVIPDILTNISRFKDLVINNNFLKDIFLYTKSGPVLQFGDLSRLNAEFSKSNLEILLIILESCPKLESFILTLVKDRSMRRKKKKEPKEMFSTVPQCLVSSLKFVELKQSKETWYEGETVLVRYLLKNATILEKLRIDVYCPENAKCGYLQELLTMPRCSSACEIHCSFNTK